jgi:hypothetical protein
MKNTLSRRQTGLVIGFALPAFAQQKDTLDPKLSQRLVALIKANTDALDKNDAAADGGVLTDSFRYA